MDLIFVTCTAVHQHVFSFVVYTRQASPVFEQYDWESRFIYLYTFALLNYTYPQILLLYVFDDSMYLEFLSHFQVYL